MVSFINNVIIGMEMEERHNELVKEVVKRLVDNELYIKLEKYKWKVKKVGFLGVVRCGSHQGGSLQNGLGDEQTCGMTLASAYVLRCLSAAWLQLQMKNGKSEWE